MTAVHLFWKSVDEQGLGAICGFLNNTAQALTMQHFIADLLGADVPAYIG